MSGNCIAIFLGQSVLSPPPILMKDTGNLDIQSNLLFVLCCKCITISCPHWYFIGSEHKLLSRKPSSRKHVVNSMTSNKIKALLRYVISFVSTMIL